MVQVAFSITKRVAFRESTQEFSNVYHYFKTGPIPALTELDGRIDEIVAIERDFHSTAVSFVRARCWSSGGAPADNDMLIQRNLTGAGNQSPDGSMDRERAFLMSWPAGVDIRGKPVFLRKWFHSCGSCVGVIPGDGLKANITRLTAAQQTTIATRGNDLRIIGTLDDYLLVAESGREHTGPGSCYPWLEHHQLGDQWRAQ